jgi:hypothetical protein
MSSFKQKNHYNEAPGPFMEDYLPVLNLSTGSFLVDTLLFNAAAAYQYDLYSQS